MQPRFWVIHSNESHRIPIVHKNTNQGLKINLRNCIFPTLQVFVQEIKDGVILSNVAKARHTLSPTWICKPQIMENINVEKHATICIHFWFWISRLLKYAVRNTTALPLALSRCTLTLSLVLIELLSFKGGFATKRRMSKYLNCKNTSSCEGSKISANFFFLFGLQTTAAPCKLTLRDQHVKLTY